MIYHEKVLPITWKTWDMGSDFGDINYYSVEFQKDFGPFKKGDVIDCLSVSHKEGSATELLNEGSGRTVRIRYVAGENYECQSTDS